MKISNQKIGLIKESPDNPRFITDDKFAKLVSSIKEFPEMLKLRPIIVNDDMVVLGGNMRLKACREAGLSMVPVIKASDLTLEQQKEFVIKDNVGFGEWDWDILQEKWETDDLENWGLEVVDFGTSEEVEGVNEMEEWVGMPEFEVKEDSFKIIIHFEDEEARKKFADDQGMRFVKKEKSAWATTFPFKGREDLASLKFESSKKSE